MIVAVMGRSIKIYITTRNVDSTKFARACVEIDLSLPIIKKIWVEDQWQQVEYESLHLICAQCGCYGHSQRQCKHQGDKKKELKENKGPPERQHGPLEKEFVTRNIAPEMVENQIPKNPQAVNANSVQF